MRLADLPVRRGFSIVEMTVVLAIIGILAMLILPRFHNSLAQRSLDDAARETNALLALGHQSAVGAGAISATPPQSQLVAPIRLSVSNLPYTCVLMDGANFTDTAVSTRGRLLQIYSNSDSVAVTAGYQIPGASGTLGASTAVLLPITLVFDTNGSLRKDPADLAMLETVPPIPAGATLTLTFHVPDLTDHTLQLDSVSGLVAFH